MFIFMFWLVLLIIGDTSCSNIRFSSMMKHAANVCVGTCLAFQPHSTHAAQLVGEFSTSGFIFKDTLKVSEFSGFRISLKAHCCRTHELFVLQIPRSRESRYISPSSSDLSTRS